MIKTLGFRISPTEVEDILMQSGQVREAAVIGVPDDMLGQYIKAFVVAQEGAVFDREILLDYCANQMPRYMVPRSVEILDNLPKTSNGKVDYRSLRRQEEV